MTKKPSPASRVRNPVPALHEQGPASQAAASFPIVGIGASAGGFEALEQFLAHVPAECGMAFVIVQHLDPTRKGLMPELLQRGTLMKVMQVKDRTRVRPDWVYVIPPNKDMSILHGALHLFEPSEKRGQRLPIDFFLRSLALDRQQNAIGVVLSGMGSDGTPGLREIKEKGGLVVAQEPSAAKFDSMPRSVIDAGLPDIVAPADELPGRIMAYLRSVPHEAISETSVDSVTRGGLEKIVILLRARTGHDFSFYKKSTLYRRIERRMGIHQIERIASYVRFLNENPQELDLLFKEFLMGVTGVFRDPQVWQVLRDKTLPAMLASHPTRLLRAWVAGCSTGEEAYSLAIVFREAIEKLAPGKNLKLQIFATDLNRDAIDMARRGVYPEKIRMDVTPEQLRRYFTKEEMQSLNEELQTVNAELQVRLDELSLANNDMKNLLNSTEVATLFLDKDLRVRRFTTQATRIIKLIPGDVGRPITDLASQLLYPELSDDVREVLRKLGSVEKPVGTRNGSWFCVRIMPYRMLDDRIDGVVITFWDITVSKTLEAKLQEMQLALENRLAGKSTELNKARTELKAERKRTRKT